MKESSFTAITSEGGLLPADFLAELVVPKTPIKGLKPEDYNLAEGERISEQVNRSWNRLKGRWADFKKAIADKQPGEATTTETRDRWLHPIFQELGFGQKLATARAIEIDGRSYPISHGWSHVPIHLVGSHVDIDRRTPGAVGAAKASPHSLVQQVLNASTDHLWGIVSNGLTFRLLRDSVALTRLSYVEWDLAAIFDGDLYSEFFVLWLVAHQSRFDAERPELCWLEKWKKSAEDKGLRALENLYPGVKTAIAALGAGLVSHPANTALREKLRSGDLTTQEFYRQVLRVIYRLLFLFVAEDRGLLHPPDDSEAALKARQRYLDFYSISRLRELTLYRAGTPHPDLWQVFQLLTGKLGTDTGCPELALPALGSFLWTAAQSTPDLLDSLISNRHFLEAVHALAFVRDGSVRRAVDYKNLGSEELGSVYQGLLELHPQVNADAGTFVLETASGNERKTTGSFYTPDSLVQCLLESALEPLIAERLAKAKTPEEKETALLSLKVCDPAVGSGHFILRAGHRIAKHLARVRSGEEEPSPAVYRTALRDVIGHCLYGVDVNPMSAELCRVSLWLEALEPGKPLSFLDHHIRVGNSLLGTTPELIAAGLPDRAFDEIEGDESRPIDGRRRLSAAAELKKLNKRERAGFGSLFAVEDSAIQQALQKAAAAIEALPDDTPEHIRQKSEAFDRAEADADFQRRKLVADTWCAAFVIPKTFKAGSDEPRGITQRHLQELGQGYPLPPDLAADAKRLTESYGFFHWHLAYPEVFANGGFDLMLGNPPWDTLSPDQREFFGKYVDGIRAMGPKEQEAEISRLIGNPMIAAEWTAHCRQLFAIVHFFKQSGVYTLYAPGNLGKGDFNIYRMFVELAIRRTCGGGYAAQIVPAGIYGGANASAIRRALLDQNELKFLAGFLNKAGVFFPGVHPQTKFALYAARVSGRSNILRAVFGIDSKQRCLDALRDSIEIQANLIRELSPETYSVPDIRSAEELVTTAKIFRVGPLFGADNVAPFRHYLAELHMGNNRDLFTDDPSGLPLYEGRMIQHFDHRAKTYSSGHGNSARWEESDFLDPKKAIVPQWRVLRSRIPSRVGARIDRFRIGFRNIAQPTDARSLIATLIPSSAVCGDTVPTIAFPRELEWMYAPWLAVACSFVMDSVARSKQTSAHLTFTLLDGLPFPRWKRGPDDPWVRRVVPTVLRLLCTGPEMSDFWNAMAEHHFVSPIRTGTVPPDALLAADERSLARAFLDACVARDLFGLTEIELGTILDTFESLRRQEEKAYNEFRTKRLILEAFSAGAELSTPAELVPSDVRTAAPPKLPAAARDNFPAAPLYSELLLPHLLSLVPGGVSLPQLDVAFGLLADRAELGRAAANFNEGRRWAESFRQPVTRADLRAALLRLAERGIVHARPAPGGPLLALDPQATPTAEPWIAADAWYSLRAALDHAPTAPTAPVAEPELADLAGKILTFAAA